jgi:DNA-binding protein H-NS
MKYFNLESLSVDALWSLRERIDSLLSLKISAEKAKLDQRLGQLAAQNDPETVSRSRRPYPPVFPKYMNPADSSQTWAGRGKLPRWLKAQLRYGKRLDDFRIPPSSDLGLRVVHQH